jgi:hypothetical protein
MILSITACTGKQADSGAADRVSKTKPAGIQAGTTFSYWMNYDLPGHLPWLDNRGSILWYQVYDNLLYKYCTACAELAVFQASI